VLPAHLSSDKILRRVKKIKTELELKLDKIIYFLRDKSYEKVLRATIKWRWIVITIPIALIIITFGMIQGTVIRTTFFPSIAFDFFNVDLAFTPGAGEKQTMEFLKILKIKYGKLMMN
jgi:multidrug efflux pump subunit AcrB